MAIRSDLRAHARARGTRMPRSRAIAMTLSAVAAAFRLGAAPRLRRMPRMVAPIRHSKTDQESRGQVFPPDLLVFLWKCEMDRWRAYARKAAPGSSAGCRLETASNDGSENRGPSCAHGHWLPRRLRKIAYSGQVSVEDRWSFGTTLAPPIERRLSWTSRAGLDGVSFGDHSTAGGCDTFRPPMECFREPLVGGHELAVGLIVRAQIRKQ